MILIFPKAAQKQKSMLKLNGFIHKQFDDLVTKNSYSSFESI